MELEKFVEELHGQDKTRKEAVAALVSLRERRDAEHAAFRAELTRLITLLEGRPEKKPRARVKGTGVTNDDVRTHVDAVREAKPHATEDELKEEVARRVESSGKSTKGLALRLAQVLRSQAPLQQRS